MDELRYDCATLTMVVERIYFGDQTMRVINISFGDAVNNRLFREKRFDEKNLDNCQKQGAKVYDAPHLIIFEKTLLLW